MGLIALLAGWLLTQTPIPLTQIGLQITAPCDGQTRDQWVLVTQLSHVVSVRVPVGLTHGVYPMDVSVTVFRVDAANKGFVLLNFGFDRYGPGTVDQIGKMDYHAPYVPVVKPGDSLVLQTYCQEWDPVASADMIAHAIITMGTP